MLILYLHAYLYVYTDKEIPTDSCKHLKLYSCLHIERKTAKSLYSSNVFVQQKLHNFQRQISFSLAFYFFFLHCSAVFEKEPVWFFGTKILLGYLQEQCFYSTVWPYRAIKFHKCMCVCVCTSEGCVGDALRWNFSTEMASNSKSISFRLNIQGICPNQRLQFW